MLRSEVPVTGVKSAPRSVADAVFPREAPLTYTLAPHVWLPGGLQMIASSRRTELNGILAYFPDGAMIRITYPAAYCRLTAWR